MVAGRIDRVDKLPDGRVVITDYKTGKPLSQEDADESLQLSIYALAAREKWGYRADHLAFYNLSENTSVLTHRSEAQLQEAQAKVEDVAQNVAEGKFDAKPSFSCRFCAYGFCAPQPKNAFDFTRICKAPGSTRCVQPRSGARIKPTAQAVGRLSSRDKSPPAPVLGPTKT